MADIYTRLLQYIYILEKFVILVAEYVIDI